MPPEFAEQLRAAAEAGAAAGERRPVTILFADLSGFTALSETLDPEDVAVLVDRCLGAMADAIYRYQGTVDKYIGDCVMALFGAPVAHEDDPERAIRAALEMRDQIAAIAAQGASPLSLHVGINTGVVVAGAVGSDRRRDYTVLGDAVNVAARLEGVATDGDIIVGEPSYRLARHVVAFESLGALSLKGRAESLQAYRVLGLLPEPTSARGLESHALSAPLIGREQELEQLFAAFERTLVGRTQVISLIGEAGAGKTRLQREFFRRLQSERPGEAARLTVRRAVCSALGEEAYGVLRAIFHDALAMAPDDPPEVVKERIVGLLTTLGQDAATSRHAAPLVGHLLGVERDDPRLRQVEPEQLKRQLFLVVRDLIDRRLQQGPYILVVEDLHWADVASIELLRFIVDRLGDRQLMLLLTHRPTFEAGSLVSSRATYSAVRLPPLSSDQSAALLGALFGDSVACLPSRLRELIIGRAGGNPFYLEEVVRGLIEAGVLVREAVGWRCAEDVAVVEVPPTVQGVLLARLDRLSPGERRLVQEASVLGLEFGEGLLRAVCSEPEAMEVHLDLLQDAELLQETARPAGALTTAERRYRFSHALVQEVAYGSLLVRRRTELHGRIGQTLEQVHGERPERLEDLEALGHHFSLSTDKLKGVRYMTAAGDSARALYANEDAARCYERALDTLAMHDAAARAQQVQLWERLGDALGAVGRRADALRNYTAALEAVEQADDRPVQARLHRKIGRLRWEAGEREPALDALRSGLSVLEGRAEHIELAHLYQEMGRLAFRSGAGEQAIAWARRAVELAERIAAAADSPDARREAAAAIAHAYNTLGIAMARTGGSEAAVEQLERSLTVAREHELLQAACRAHTNLGVLYSTLDPGRAIETCLDGLDLARKIGDLGLQPWLYANLAGAYCTFTGQCEEQGIAAAQQAIELDRQLGQLDHLAVPLIVLGQIYQCHSEPARALQYYQEALSLAEQMGEPQLLFPCYDGLATLNLEGGDVAEAERYMLKAQEVCERAGLDPESLVVLPFLG